MKQITVEVKKNFFGKLSLRDYVVEEAIKEGMDILVRHRDKEILIRNEDLHMGRVMTNCKFHSKIRNAKHKSYYLIDFDIKKIREAREDKQQTLF